MKTMSDKQGRPQASEQKIGQDEKETEGFTTHTYDTERAFIRMLNGDENARTEFYQLLDRDIEERVKSAA